MHNVLDNIDELELNKIDLDTEYKKALKNPNFKAITKNLKLDESELKKYTSFLEEASLEYEHCKNCKNLLECKNKVEGFCYLPINNNGNLTFTYKPCKYKEVEVISGDTLWSIAKEENRNNAYYEGKDIRYVVYEIDKLNNIGNNILREGDKIKVPVI